MSFPIHEDHPVVDRQGVEIEVWRNEEHRWTTHRSTLLSAYMSGTSRITPSNCINRTESTGEPGFGEPVTLGVSIMDQGPGSPNALTWLL